jgi:hypothetical protein
MTAAERDAAVQSLAVRLASWLNQQTHPSGTPEGI